MSVKEGMLVGEALEGASAASIVSIGDSSALRTHAVSNALAAQGIKVDMPANNCNSFNAASAGGNDRAASLVARPAPAMELARA